LPARVFAFPQDDGAHDGYATEWWRTFGRLADATGNHYDVSLNVSRFAVHARGASATGAWRVRHLFTLSYQMLDERTGRTFGDVRVEREGVLGGRAAIGHLEIELPGLRVRGRNDTSRTFAFDVRVRGVTVASLVEHPARALPLGPHGVMRTGSCDACVAYAYADPRSAASGTLAIDGSNRAVHGALWFEHEFAHHELAAQDGGWDRFDVTLDDGRAFDVRILRTNLGNAAFASGAYVAANGSVTYLAGDDASATVFPPTSTALGADSETRYPTSWNLSITAVGASFPTSPLARYQDVVARGRVPYYNGAISVEDDEHGGDAGYGYVELVGRSRKASL
jgi:predicted secreted hydrolase